jgi:tetratricopeptide (TPR) repeat protein
MNAEHKQILSRADRLREDESFQEALNLLLALSNSEPESPAVLCVLGHTYWDMHQLDDAIATFKRAIEMRPAAAAASLGLFHCLWDQGKHCEALEEVKRFMSVADSSDERTNIAISNYRAIVSEINEKWGSQ